MAITRTSTIDTSSDNTCHGPNLEFMNVRGVAVFGPYGQQYVYGDQRYCTFEDDFNGGSVAFSTTVNGGWRSRKGSDGACVDWTVTPAVNGTVAGVIGNTTASMAVAGVQLDRGLSHQANQGDLWFEARVKISKITNIAVFIGLTDQTAALEMPIQSAGTADTITTNATDAVGFMFDTSMTTDTWWLVGVKNDVDATAQNSAAVPVADTYQIFRVELTTAGVATFYIDGTAVGTAMTGAVTATVALTPVIAGFNRTTSGAGTITVDRVYVSSLRV